MVERKRRERREEQEHPEEGQAGEQAGHGARHQHEVVDEARPGVVLAMRRQTDRGVADDRQRTADDADQHRVDDAAHQRRLAEHVAEVVEREHVGQAHAFAPVGDERTQGDSRERHDHGR